MRATTALSTRMTVPLFAVTILLSSYLIFQVQPLISKFILPWFGGTPAVWSTCMLFFQLTLFAGYAYAHGLVRWCRPGAQCCVHTGLLAAALALLPLAPDAAWKDQAAQAPVAGILLLLAATVGLPYFVLCATGPLLQAWISQPAGMKAPYRLYALSNLGSVAGLVAYPFVVEPNFSVDRQTRYWSVAFLVYAAACSACAVDAWRRARETHGREEAAPSRGPAGGVSVSRRLLWFGLAACGSMLLLAVTNQVCLDVAVVPFLWVLPLTIYLVSFIVCFDRENWYSRKLFGALAVLATIGQLLVLRQGQEAPLAAQVAVHMVALAVWCMICHAELVRLKPAPRHLTTFYMHLSAGGAAGGLFVGLLAPLLFTGYVELLWGLLAAWLLVIGAWLGELGGLRLQRRNAWVAGLMLAALLCLARELRALATERLEGELEACRNFYGILRVADQAGPAGSTLRCLVHGRILHGQQFTAQGLADVPTTYYGEQSGVAMALGALGKKPSLRVGVVGLGVGTLAAYGRQGDLFRFYEINPDVCRMARAHFSYLSRSPARVEIVPGDARLSLERELPQAFDLLVLDAFSSDAIPAHLLTREAFAVYRRQMGPGGVMAVHISNRHFDLEPVLRAAADELGLAAARVHSAEDASRSQQAAHWMLLAPAKFLQDPALAKAIAGTPQSVRRVPAWTDAYTSLLALLK